MTSFRFRRLSMEQIFQFSKNTALLKCHFLFGCVVCFYFYTILRYLKHCPQLTFWGTFKWKEGGSFVGFPDILDISLFFCRCRYVRSLLLKFFFRGKIWFINFGAHLCFRLFLGEGWEERE